jgi:sugar/nucleoside kinase (ribokinase family)
VLSELASGRRLSLDGHALVRPARLGRIEPDAAFDPATLAAVDVLHLSEDEVEALGLRLEPESLRTLGVPEIVVTLGERGSIVAARDLFEPVSARVVNGADPTGAGDAFTAAYIAARRAGEAPVPSAETATGVVRGLLQERSSS